MSQTQLRRESPGQHFDLTSLGGSIVSHWKLIITFVLLGVAASLVMSLLRPPLYTASQQFVVQGVIAQPLSVQLGAAASDTSSLVNTQVSILTGPHVQASVTKALRRKAPVPTVITAASDLTMTVLVADTSPSAARDSINAYASSYLQVLRTQGADQLERSANVLREQIGSLQQQLRTTSNDNLVTGLNARLEQEQSSLDSLEIQLANGTTVVQRIGSADIDSNPSGLGVTSTAAIGAAAGGLAGIALAAFLDWRAWRIRGSARRAP